MATQIPTSCPTPAPILRKGLVVVTVSLLRMSRARLRARIPGRGYLLICTQIICWV